MIEIKTKEDFLKKNQHPTPIKPDIQQTITTIQNEIITNKDNALLNYTHQFDSPNVTSLIVSPEEITSAKKQVSADTLEAFNLAKENITNFHNNQIPFDWEEEQDNGIIYGMQYKPIEKAGLYVPGGRALYPSTVLMNAIPAKLAGVSQLIMTTPPQKDGKIAAEILVAADLCNVDTIIKAGGAQAIFALAYGTQSVPKVDKIVGPGNIYVDQAKQRVYGQCDIDKPAGPSEVCVYVEDIQYAAFAAAELLAQCEHDPDASVIAIAPDLTILNAIQEECKQQINTLNRQDIIKQSCQNSALVIVKNRTEAIAMLNEIASEHLVLLLDDAEKIRKKIQHAGSIFCGPYTPVALGDYIAGPNHVLPTNKAARFSSPLNVMDFMKFSSHLTYKKRNLNDIQPQIKTLTDIEELDAHYQSVKIRLQ